ncbi:MAG: DUF4846 domain-containing protein [Deltaproteobacteria bacterium]|nr:DUF4846 domain-containing protein [Deltaproteobacteria bacterium]
MGPDRRLLALPLALGLLAACGRGAERRESADGTTASASATTTNEREAGRQAGPEGPDAADDAAPVPDVATVAPVVADAVEPPAVPASNRLADRIPSPPGFTRVPVEDGSFAAWLRALPLKPGRPNVLLFDGREKGNQQAHFAVVEISVGDRDLQQCADAVMRLRAEWLFAEDRLDEIAFDFTSGERVDFLRWSQGWRPRVADRRVSWTRGGRPGKTHDDLLAYLTRVFIYAGSASLARELEPLDADELRAGDLFVRGGFPGHAVLVVDLARDATGRTLFLLVQSYMPAQEVHVLVNPTDRTLSPWYDLAFGEQLRTPEWTFRRGEARRFPETRRRVSR